METTAKKLYYSIKEAAALLKESEPTLRYWESEFQDIISPRRNGRGVRLYQEKDMDDIRLIQYYIRDCGLTLDGVRRKLKNNKESAVRQAKAVQHLKNIKTELKAFREALDEAEKQRSRLRDVQHDQNTE